MRLCAPLRLVGPPCQLAIAIRQGAGEFLQKCLIKPLQEYQEEERENKRLKQDKINSTEGVAENSYHYGDCRAPTSTTGRFTVAGVDGDTKRMRENRETKEQEKQDKHFPRACGHHSEANPGARHHDRTVGEPRRRGPHAVLLPPSAVGHSEGRRHPPSCGRQGEGEEGSARSSARGAAPTVEGQAAGCVQHHETLCIIVGGEQHV